MRVAPLPTRITVISGFLPFFFFSFSFFQVDLKVTPTPRRTTVSFHCRLMGRNESAICDGLKKKREWRPLDPLTNVSFSTGTKIYRSCEKRFLKMLNMKFLSFSLMIFKNLLLFQDLIDSESFYEYDDYYIFEYFRAFLFTIKFLIL